MLTPSLQLHNVDGVIVGEFWDCLRLDPRPVSELREAYERHLQAKGRPEVRMISALSPGDREFAMRFRW